MSRKAFIESYLRHNLGLNFEQLHSASADASFRRYFRIESAGQSYIVMDAPPDKEPCAQFVRVTQYLQSIDINVPHIHHQNQRDGILLLTDFGPSNYLDVIDEGNVDDLYGSAISTLIKMQSGPAMPGLPLYSSDLLMQEMQLFVDWLLQGLLQIRLAGSEQQQLIQVFELLVKNALSQPQVFVHRDYHSRNLMYPADCYPGVIDHQDAVLGPVSYDLVSLLKDCYIKWPETDINGWVADYLARSSLIDDPQLFYQQFDLMGAQRHLKASGIFARLWLRDKKPGYLPDIPRTLNYIVDLKDKYKPLGALIECIEQRVLPVVERLELPCTQ